MFRAVKGRHGPVDDGAHRGCGAARVRARLALDTDRDGTCALFGAFSAVAGAQAMMTSAIVPAMIALLIGYEAVSRLFAHFTPAHSAEPCPEAPAASGKRLIQRL